MGQGGGQASRLAQRSGRGADAQVLCGEDTKVSSGSRTVARWRSGGQLTWLPSTTCVRSELARTVLLSVAVTILERLKNEESDVLKNREGSPTERASEGTKARRRWLGLAGGFREADQGRPRRRAGQHGRIGLSRSSRCEL